MAEQPLPLEQNAAAILWLTETAVLPPETLQAYEEVLDYRTFHSLDEVTGLEAPAVLLLTPAQAVDFLKGPAANSRRPARVALIIWAVPNDGLERWLLSHPQVVGMLDSASSRDAIYLTIKSALILLQQVDNDKAAETLEHVLEIGRALASEKDLDTLLDLILSHARRLTGADGATIFTRDPNGKLYFRLWQNYSTETTSSAQKTLVGDYSIAGYVARTGDSVTIEDAYTISGDMPYKFNPASDRSIGYRTRSMLTLPLANKAGEVVGVLQLINRKANSDIRLTEPEDFEEQVLPFDAYNSHVAQALAGQAGVALENSILYADIEHLFEGFIKASVQAIEARDPTTAGHSFRVAKFTERLSKAVDKTDLHGLRAIGFTGEQLREIRYAALLHDFGKVGVRERVLVKADKLYPYQLEQIEQRFRYARAAQGKRALEEIMALIDAGGLGPEELAVRRREIEAMLAAEDARLQRFLETVIQANKTTVLHQENTDDLAAVAEYTFPGENGEQLPLLHEFEFSNLALGKGSLSPEERNQIESHVSHTFDFLNLIPWTRNLSKLPNIAAAHHEKLDGSGYPQGLVAEEIPVQSKIMTIADIYDALTAADRPYKKALPTDRALDILQQEAREGKIDANLLQVFVGSKSYALIKG